MNNILLCDLATPGDSSDQIIMQALHCKDRPSLDHWLVISHHKLLLDHNLPKYNPHWTKLEYSNCPNTIKSFSVSVLKLSPPLCSSTWAWQGKCASESSTPHLEASCRLPIGHWPNWISQFWRNSIHWFLHNTYLDNLARSQSIVDRSAQLPLLSSTDSIAWVLLIWVGESTLKSRLWNLELYGLVWRHIWVGREGFELPGQLKTDNLNPTNVTQERFATAHSILPHICNNWRKRLFSNQRNTICQCCMANNVE